MVAKHLAERDIIKLWQRQPGCRRLVDSEGMPVEIVYPGRPNDGRGADFRDAVVTSAGERRLGHIEVHSKVSGWLSHGHYRDPVYNQVVLHVAWKQDKSGRTVLQNGTSVPTVILGEQPDRDAAGGLPVADLPCREAGLKWGREEILAALAMAGNTRFLAKAARFQAEISSVGAGESLYQGILEALGYARNKQPFLELARRVPLSRLEQIVNDRAAGEAALAGVQALLLERGGFLFSGQIERHLPEEYLRKLQAARSNLLEPGVADYPDWELFRVRPGNHPIRRILAFSHLILRVYPRGLLGYLLDLVSNMPLVGIQGRFEAALVVHSSCNPVLLGRERAAAIIVNVLLPFTYAWRKPLDSSISQKALEIFSQYPRSGTSSIERHMLNQLGLSSREINSACRQQGLVHIFKNFCTLGRCEECLLGQADSRFR